MKAAARIGRIEATIKQRAIGSKQKRVFWLRDYTPDERAALSERYDVLWIDYGYDSAAPFGLDDLSNEKTAPDSD